MNKTAVITGASSGMGRATAGKMLEKGWAVVLADLSLQALNDTAAGLATAYPGSEVNAWTVDVSSEEQVRNFAADVKEKCGTVNAVINCAGVFRGGLLHESATEDLDFQMNINLKGSYLMMKYFVPMMLGNGGNNSIITISSASGVNGDYNAPLYCASKAAVIGLTKAAALDYAGAGIRINCVAPSATETPMFLNGSTQEVIDAFKKAIPDHRIGKPEEIANTIAWLCSDEATHVVGNVIRVDGGLTAWNGQPRQDKEAAQGD